MKAFRTVLIWFILIAFFVTFAVFTFISLHGNKIVSRHLTHLLKRPVIVKKVKPLPIWGLRLEGIQVPGLIEIKSLEIYLRPPVFEDGYLTIAKVALDNPECIFYKKPDLNIFSLLSWLEGKKIKLASLREERLPVFLRPNIKQDLGLAIDSIEVHNGKLFFFDPARPERASLTLADLNFKARGIYYPLKGRDIPFELYGRTMADELVWRRSEIRTTGWVNWPRRNSRTTMRISNPAGIEVMVNAYAQKNEMQVKGRFWTDLPGADPSILFSGKDFYKSFFLGLLQMIGTHVDMGFEFSTRMDDVRIDSDKITFSGELGYDSRRFLKTLKQHFSNGDSSQMSHKEVLAP